jgi:hypothetical protein
VGTNRAEPAIMMKIAVASATRLEDPPNGSATVTAPGTAAATLGFRTFYV